MAEDVTAAAIQRRIEEFVAVVVARHSSGDEVFRWSRLEEVMVRPGVPLCDLLYGAVESIALDSELRLALLQVVNRCVHWDDRFESCESPMVRIGEAEFSAPTITVVTSRISAGCGSACLTLGDSPPRGGLTTVQAESGACEVHFISAEAQVPGFFRTLFELEDMKADAYMDNALDAFPRLAFVPGLASQMSSFATRYRDVRKLVTKHLTALNDVFPDVFARHHGNPSETSRELAARCGVDASPESPNTRANGSAMREREVAVSNVLSGRRSLLVRRTVTCEWHTKITPVSDRIHFHPGLGGAPESRPAEGKVIVGIFARHLSI